MEGAPECFFTFNHTMRVLVYCFIAGMKEIFYLVTKFLALWFKPGRKFYIETFAS
jgi:hypothetical protein